MKTAKTISKICFMSGIFSIWYWFIRYDVLGSHEPKYLCAAIVIMLAFFVIAAVIDVVSNKIDKKHKARAAMLAAIRKHNADMFKIVCNRVNMNIDV